MAYHLWTPFALAIVIKMFEYVVLWNTPETSPFVTTKGVAHPVRSLTQDHRSSTMKHWREILAAQIQRSSLWVVFKHRGLNIIFACFFIKRIAFASEDFVSQYVSEILQCRIFETFWLQACNHLGMLLALSVLIPFLTRHLKSPVKDLWVIYGSLVNVMIGFLVLWCGRSILILCLGMFQIRLLIALLTR
jgi:hypothetical protein